ncbi:Hypothetical predicted protein [Xyrichtys novacula]|uniref:Uncharacterized protein n=1 Tax=Xyrichtys novacula TaxID=13765 RepID=A0AAV1GAF3_XYRNO|nr:Hypothetical predicted protein [Xyrichtys novacula]
MPTSKPHSLPSEGRSSSIKCSGFPMFGVFLDSERSDADCPFLCKENKTLSAGRSLYFIIHQQRRKRKTSTTDMKKLLPPAANTHAPYFEQMSPEGHTVLLWYLSKSFLALMVLSIELDLRFAVQ